MNERRKPRLILPSSFSGRDWPFLLIGVLLLVNGFCSGQNLLQNPGFESGTAGWYGFGPVTLTAPSTTPHSGNRSALVANRTETWNGVAQSLLGLIQPGTNYTISAWVRLSSGGSQPVRLTMKKSDDSGTGYEQVANGTGTASNWTQLSGTYQLRVTGTLSELELYMEGPASGVSLYADDFVVEAQATTSARAIDATVTHQTIEGFGGAIAFYGGWLTAHPYKQEIYTNVFKGLNLSLLRLGNWFRYQSNANFDPDATEIVSNGERILGRPVPILMSSWSPPAFLKSNGATTNGGTLARTNGSFNYAGFGAYWYDALLRYKTNGVIPTYISIQNEPDWGAAWDTCLLHPSEDSVGGTNYASYAKALDATYQRVTNLPSPPKILGPEVLGIGSSAVQNYASKMTAANLYGVAHHLYSGGAEGNADSFVSTMQSLTNVFPEKPRFQTEYGETNMIQCALLMHNSLTAEEVSGYLFWSLVWPVGGSALVQQEYPWDRGSWTNAPAGTATQSHGYWLTPVYYAMKHYSYFIGSGYKRVETGGDVGASRLSAYLAKDSSRLVLVMINPNAGAAALACSVAGFTYSSSGVYQTAGANAEVSRFAWLGSAPTNLQWALPGYSITTVVLDAPAAGVASNPNPTNGAFNVPVAPNLSWRGGSNATSHRVYFGYSSNAVATAAANSAEYRGSISVTNYSPGTLASSGRFFWRVDEVCNTNVTLGPVWTFATVVNPADAPLLSGTIQPANGTFAVSFTSGLGQTYRIERSDRLGVAGTTWIPMTNSVPGIGGVLRIVDPGTPLPSQRYYRAVRLTP